MNTYSRTNPPPGCAYLRLSRKTGPAEAEARCFRLVAHTLGIRRMSDDTPYDGMEFCLLCPLECSRCGYPCGPDGRDTFVRTDALPLLALEGLL